MIFLNINVRVSEMLRCNQLIRKKKKFILFYCIFINIFIKIIQMPKDTNRMKSFFNDLILRKLNLDYDW